MTGLRMPAEWELHEATWLAWPHERTDWPGKFAPIPFVYAEIVRHLSKVERVRILVQDYELECKAKRMLRRAGANLAAVEFFPIETDRSWCRDFCPIFVRQDQAKRGQSLRILDWRFNGWAKYDNYESDDEVAGWLSEGLAIPKVEPGIVLEGGSIDVNGAGTILTTEECLLSDVQQRNPGLTRLDYESTFNSFLGASKTVWLKNGIAGDDTHGHVDDLARFTSEDTVVIAAEEDPLDANYEPLRENLALLRALTLHVHTLPMPAPVFYDGQRLPASYANFYIANGIVLAPTFNDANDRIALNKLAELFPDRKVIGIASTDLVLGLGTLHCMTQQQPA